MKPAIDAWVEKYGITMSVEFIPFSKSRNASEKQPSLNWKVTLNRKTAVGSILPVITTDYSAGCAHCPSYKGSYPGTIYTEEAIDYECEHGQKYFANHISSEIPILPKVEDVLHSLNSDSDALNYSTFEDWAANFGCDPDSRKAEAIYRACLEIALRLRNHLGEAALSELATLMQDY